MPYTFRASLRGKDVCFDVIDGVLTSSAGLHLPLTEIVNILWYEASRNGCFLWLRKRSGGKLVLTSRHVIGLGRFEDRSTALDTFREQLFAEAKKVAPAPALLVGPPEFLWWLWVVLLAIFTIAYPLAIGAILSAAADDKGVSVPVVWIGTIGVATILFSLGMRRLRQARQLQFK